MDLLVICLHYQIKTSLSSPKLRPALPLLSLTLYSRRRIDLPAQLPAFQITHSLTHSLIVGTRERDSAFTLFVMASKTGEESRNSKTPLISGFKFFLLLLTLRIFSGDFSSEKEEFSDRLCSCFFSLFFFDET